jgi:drug/metabolite transporter (DMT)-like permease
MKRPVRTLIQIIAAGLMVLGALEIGLEIVHHQIQVHNHVDPIKTDIWRYIIGAVLLLLGMILFAGSESLAEQLTDDIDDTDE